MDEEVDEEIDEEMGERTEVVTVKLEDNTCIKIAATSLAGEQNVFDANEILSFTQVAESIEGIAKTIMSTLQKVKPNKASVEFGIEIALGAGGLTALLVKGGGTANLKIILEWIS